MTDFVKITDYAAKDALLTGNPAKLVKGVEIGADFDAVAVAVATKHDAADIGVTVQAYSANLDEYAAVNPTAAGLAILDDATASDQLTTLGGTVVGKAVFTAATASDQLTTLGGTVVGKAVFTAATVAAAQQATDTEVGVDVMAYVAPGTSGNILTSNGAAWTSATPTTTTSTEQGLTQFYYPANGSAYQDLYRSGFLPSWFNQQWGGSQWGTLPDGSFGSVATGNVQDDYTGYSIGFNTTQYQAAGGFYLSEAMTSPAVWLKLYKVGNPTDNVTVSIYSDNSDKPNALIGSAATISAKVLASKTDGEWYSVTPTPGVLSANTRYWVVVSRSGAVDSTNYVQLHCTLSNKNPNCKSSLSNSTPTWTTNAAQCPCFLIQNPAANSLIQSGGQFDYKLSFAAGSPVNQSRSVAQPLVNFYDGKNCTVLYRGTYSTGVVFDYLYGLDHDRIMVWTNGSGYPVLEVYKANGSRSTVTGTVSVTSGSHDVGIRVRTVGDGADYAYLYVDGVSVGTPLTSQTFTMSAEFARLGTARLGDGFANIAGAWTQDMQMTALPSAQGWTWTGTATEANAMSIQGGKLYQNKNGYTSGQTGYYDKTVSFSNTTGWTVSVKCRVPTGVNADSSLASTILVHDGTKSVTLYLQEYFVQLNGSGAIDFTLQGDFKSQEHVFTLCGKGSDYYLFIDGKLAVDGTGKLTNASATNAIRWGDFTATTDYNADAIWSYVKYYGGGMILPTAGANTCSEFAHWSGDKSALFPSLYNSGSPVSVKQLCGVPRNYQFEQVVQREVRRGVTAAPTTTATSAGVMTDMEAYVIGSDIRQFHESVVINSTTGSTVVLQQSLDGVNDVGSTAINATASGAVYQNSANSVSAKSIPLGLHKSEGRWYVSANTGTASNVQRQFTVEGRS